MAQCVVIADEITGARAVGALLQKNRSTVCSLVSSRGLKDAATKDFDCLVYSTNSRNLMPNQSYQMVFYAGKLLKSSEVKLYAKRIDPAMRGNTCSETQALLDALGDEDRVAIVVPAFPELKRSNVGGYILVDGKPIQKSLIGLDDLRPAASGRVADLFIEKFRYKTDVLYLKDLFHGSDYLANKIKACAENGARAIVLDCTSQQDINTIADALNPYEDWEKVLAAGVSSDLKFVFSNTTEAGITFVHEQPFNTDVCPESFPGKLTAILYERYKAFKEQGALAGSGLWIVPCELLDDNGSKLKDIVLQQIEDQHLDEDFKQYVLNECRFINTLVDRVVSGYPKDNAAAYQEKLGYQDELMTCGECFHFFAIEGGEDVAEAQPLSSTV